MLGPLFIYSLLVIICVLAVVRPAIGLIGFYGFVLLDPAWNWRWSLEPGIAYQKYIFYALFIGFVLSGLRLQGLSRISLFALAASGAFLGVAWLSAQSSISPTSTDIFMAVIWKQLLVVAIGLCVLRDPKWIKVLLIVAVLAQGYNAYQINLDYFQSGMSRFAYDTKWGNSGADNNGYSIITIPILGTAFALALFESRIWYRSLYFGIAMLQVHQIMLLQSRGCMLAGVAMVALLVWYMPRRNGNLKAVAAAFVLGAALAGPSVVEEFTSSFASGEERDSSADSRFKLWKAGFRITTEYPLLGVGPNAARVLVPKPEYYDGGLEQSNKALHNLFFDVSTGVGIPGFLCYFTLYLLPVFYAWRTYHRDDEETGAIRLAVFAGIFGYLVASMFSSGILFESCYVLVVAGFCVSNFDEQRRREAAWDEGYEVDDDKGLEPSITSQI
ncbi:O-antigen ligase family protein [Rosistilla oblonga]|uniref:O-antigen ligase family protein n=1 Tax=Rosistilla oblonga TaxID=2527990 RepID=UPI003A97164A